ncbi:kinase-like domain-containing protein [Dactylonectria estremocensis]|uniref:non-specific serine/threonine protein kinase n=1 Tax=Dactylonectria estremocensis TaxID=1079267 RepID=A0A9P9JIX3_9HYPO|nr:kinase-like domain-containing protein [Dactylonectria estremocensis]
MIPKDFIRNLGLEQTGPASTTTVVLRPHSLEGRGSLQALARVQTPSSSVFDTSQSSKDMGQMSLGADQSTRKTSMDSRFSCSAKPTTNRRHSRRNPWTRSSPEGGTLNTIQESGIYQIQPTFKTVERAAAAKIFLETTYSKVFHSPDKRGVRRRYLESQLFYSPHLTLEQKQAIRESFNIQETWHLRETRVMKSQSPTLGVEKLTHRYPENYEPLQVLGKGSFGVVRLVRERHASGHALTKQVYAMKVIRKSEMLRSCQEGHLRAERDFLVSSEGSNWVVPLICSFQDTDNLYLVMEYMPGGDFLGLLIRENILNESVARFYIAEMILAVEEAHRLKFIHRDIKPDNFLISASGHLKISDFGLAFDGHWSHDASYFNSHRYSLVRKLGIKLNGDEVDQKKNSGILTQFEWYKSLVEGLERHGKLPIDENEDLESLISWRNQHGNRTAANSVVGTSQYMAPEQTKINIQHFKKHFGFPPRPFVSDKCKDLIYRLMQDEKHRICSKRYYMKDRGHADSSRFKDFFGRHVFPDDAEDIKSHRWFKNVPWDHLQSITPPFIPHIHSVDDTHYFDESDLIENWSESSPTGVLLTPDDVRQVLHDFEPRVQSQAIKLIESPFDSTKLRQMDHQIQESRELRSEEKEMLKHFVRLYGQKERKRPRDILLRDQDIKDDVMNIRKKTAFMGYTWRRMRPGGYTATRETGGGRPSHDW